MNLDLSKLSHMLQIKTCNELERFFTNELDHIRYDMEGWADSSKDGDPWKNMQGWEKALDELLQQTREIRKSAVKKAG